MKLLSLAIVTTMGVLGGPAAAPAYELATHARISYRALLQSRSYADSTLIRNLGLVRGWRSSLGSTYYDTFASAMAIRTAQTFDFDRDKMPDFDHADVEISEYRNMPHGWLMAGAVREDDGGDYTTFGNSLIFNAQPEPRDDPWNNFNRFCSHFFDPINNRAYTHTCPSLYTTTAPIWAIGVHGPFAVPLTSAENPDRRNDFTVIDARNSMWTALTGRHKDGRVVAGTEQERLRYWATMFRALGDVLHLNQDMAQPQHARDEDHGFGHSAWYEKYIDGRAKGYAKVTYDWPTGSLTADGLQPLVYSGYPSPAFPSYAAYWSTGLGTASHSGLGLADYSNHGFFTPGANFGTTRYQRPLSTPIYTEVEIGVGSSGARNVYLDGSVHDNLLGTDSRPIHMTRTSLVDYANRAAARHYGTQIDAKIYSLDRATFDDRAELLIPRAVGYSAGLLDHFFRGQMSLGPPAEGVYATVDHAVENARDTGGFSRIRAMVANTTPGEAMSNGAIVAVIRYRLDTCYVDDLSGVPAGGADAIACRSPTELITVSDPIALPNGLSTEPASYTFEFPAKLPINSTDVLLQVVYRGQLGNETDAVAVVAKDLSEPTYFAYHNATDFIHIAGKVYSRAEVNASAQLLSLVAPQSCVDYSQNPAQLKPPCLQPEPLTMTFGTGSAPQSTIIDQLPPRRFARIAFLAEGATTTLNQLVYHCLPAEPFVLNNLRWQMEADPYTGSQQLHYASYVTLRGINGWVQASCVLSGDGSLSGVLDDRDTKLDAVADKYPYPVQILPP